MKTIDIEQVNRVLEFINQQIQETEEQSNIFDEQGEMEKVLIKQGTSLGLGMAKTIIEVYLLKDNENE